MGYQSIKNQIRIHREKPAKVKRNGVVDVLLYETRDAKPDEAADRLRECADSKEKFQHPTVGPMTLGPEVKRKLRAVANRLEEKKIPKQKRTRKPNKKSSVGEKKKSKAQLKKEMKHVAT